MVREFKGSINLHDQTLRLFKPNKTAIEQNVIRISDLQDDQLVNLVGKYDASRIREGVEIIEGVYEFWNMCLYREAPLPLVFFGSTLNNFGIQEMQNTFIRIDPPPGKKEATMRTVLPKEKQFNGFVCKNHVNFDPKHRD